MKGFFSFCRMSMCVLRGSQREGQGGGSGFDSWGFFKSTLVLSHEFSMPVVSGLSLQALLHTGHSGVWRDEVAWKDMSGWRAVSLNNCISKQALNYIILWLVLKKSQSSSTILAHTHIMTKEVCGSFTPKTTTILTFIPTDVKVLHFISVRCSYVVFC